MTAHKHPTSLADLEARRADDVRAAKKARQERKAWLATSAPVPASDCSPVSGAGTNPIGAVAMPTLHGSTGEATAPNLSTPTMPCRECGGKGEAEYMGLCDRYYRWADCHSCFGSGVEVAYCETCEGALNAAGDCPDCDYPSGWFLAERMALGMVKP